MHTNTFLDSFLQTSRKDDGHLENRSFSKPLFGSETKVAAAAENLVAGKMLAHDRLLRSPR